MPPHIGTIHLTVADLDRSIAYYESQIGLRVHGRENGSVRLGTGGEDLLALTELGGWDRVQPADGYAGLFHFALLVPERADLARWLAHAGADRVPLTGLSDHFVSEALYLRDPDGHGIEIYADRPREVWEGRVAAALTTIPLDTDDLLAAADGPYDGLAAGTTMGHVHLRVTDLDESIAYYRDQLGMDLMASFPGQAGFLSWGGYHHHLGVNVWESRGAPRAPDGYATLDHFEVLDARETGERTDPSGLRLTLKAAPSP
jgi:catechol 2,3-dioxygenase